MDANQLLERFSPFIKKNILSLVLTLFGLIFFGYGLIVLLGQGGSLDKQIFFEPAEYSLEGKSQIKVDVAGEVVNPGVYSLELDARIQDALVAAGGLSKEADREWVSKNLNLAQKLADGTKIYIPRVGGTVKSITGSTSITSTTGTIGGEQININTARQEMLESLPGVGSVTARKIIDGRPYSSIGELLQRKIVGQKVFGEIKEKVTVY